MRSKTLLLTFFLAVLLVAPGSLAIGATGCGARYVNYEPHARVEFAHTVVNAYDYNVALEGVWADSMTITSQEGTTVRGYLTMPPNWDEPGTMRNFVTFSEVPPPDRVGTAVAVTRVRCPIYVLVPYPGEYLEFDFTTKDINEGDIAQANYFIASRGDDPVDDARLTISVEKNGTTYTSFSERLRRIQPREELRDVVDLNTESLDPGIYSVRGLLSYSTDDVLVERSLRVGELDVIIANHSRTLPTSDFTRINFTLENQWNSRVDNVVLSYRITNEGQRFGLVTTETFSIPAFGTHTVRSIAETPGVVEGTSFIEYTLSFDGNTKSGVLPIFFERDGPDMRILIFILIGLLLTITVVLAVVILKRTSKKQSKSPTKPNRRKR